MEEKDFWDLTSKLKEYLEANKTFIQNPMRIADVQCALKTAKELFPDAKSISIDDDPLQMGALIITIRDYDLSAVGQENIALFSKLIEKANNFEISPYGECEVVISIMFNDALIRIG